MSTKPKRQPRRVGNPLMLIAGKQRIGADVERLLAPFAANLAEVALGHGDGGPIRTVTLYLAAAFDLARWHRLTGLLQLTDRAGDQWVAAGERSRRHGIEDRIVVNGDELEAARRVLRALYRQLPTLELATWVSCMENARRRWDAHAAASPVFAPAAREAA